jgi:hypothetical protein
LLVLRHERVALGAVVGPTEDVMKALIGGIVGALLLGGVLLLFGGQRTNGLPATFALDASSVDPMLVNCGEGRQALVRPVAAGQRISQVECVAAPAALPRSYGLVPAVQTIAAPQPVVERVVYREPVVARRAPVRRRTVVRDAGRSWKKSALIIGGSAAGGAGLGAIVNGKGGARKGAVIGGIGGLVYDLATRDK